MPSRRRPLSVKWLCVLDSLVFPDAYSLVPIPCLVMLLKTYLVGRVPTCYLPSSPVYFVPTLPRQQV